jgi:hypothetical protein
MVQWTELMQNSGWTGTDMHRILFTALVAALLGGTPAGAQQPAAEPPAAEPQPEERAEQPSQQAEPAAADTPEGEKSDSEADEAGTPDVDEKTVLDDQTFEGEDDEFIPTEEIPVSEPIPFPVDI